MPLSDDLRQLQEQAPVEVAHREILAHCAEYGVVRGVTCGRIAIGPPTGRPYCDLLHTAVISQPARVNLWCPTGDQVQAAAGVVNVPWSEYTPFRPMLGDCR
jgi:hypothetical protein